MSSFKPDTTDSSGSDDEEIANHDRYDEAHELSESSEMDESVDTNLSQSHKFSMQYGNRARDEPDSPISSRGDSPPRFDPDEQHEDLESSSSDFSLGEESRVTTPPLVLTARPMTSRRTERKELTGRLSEDETSSDEESLAFVTKHSEQKQSEPSSEEDSDESEEEEVQVQTAATTQAAGDGGAGSKGGATAGTYNAADWTYLVDTTELKMLFDHIGRYAPKDCEIDTTLQPFIPDFIPTLGTSPDVFLKVPLPDGNDDPLGLELLDEPSGAQTDAAMMELQLRATSKVVGASHASATVRTMEGTQKEMSAQIDSWISNVAKLHKMNAPAEVQYSRDMPDIDGLMQVWPEDLEQALVGQTLPGPELEIELEYYARMICGMLDIPVHPGKITQSLHLLFTLYSEFQANQHFNKPTQCVEGEDGF
jgi:intraflagellar transport protein 46